MVGLLLQCGRSGRHSGCEDTSAGLTSDGATLENRRKLKMSRNYISVDFYDRLPCRGGDSHEFYRCHTYRAAWVPFIRYSTD